MASLQIALDAPFCTKKEFLRRTGWSTSSLDRAIARGEIPILPKKGEKGSVLINLVKVFERSAEQEV
ncbi:MULTISPECIES: Rha family transcriptional regulator [Vibrio]|uniref:Rha family transcriptional regulator n=1 Tax=Vibrio tasmaniensis TaxID=212663 RepID=A0A2N7NH53_9VIBR|nr:Rha family transcriptional regulator [Vibrio tasmaniensis]PMP13772.1 Rha family transcriptional regulator [Vibrio tasmaniensis]TKG28462.1 Rha family transcriptional regulator [Vibrio tasmaniensis]TKG39064.1 Rha family transcriptional regulator [Vibrio tasmaniensis]TKG44615.1 Rha family transcriptional regulator [Vibrio tasmaniensis]TKG46137.1 Rha family transcriptional regulator [Vibrio tasmaniensis]